MKCVYKAAFAKLNGVHGILVLGNLKNKGKKDQRKILKKDIRVTWLSGHLSCYLACSRHVQLRLRVGYDTFCEHRSQLLIK